MFGVALAMRLTLSGPFTYGLNGHRKEDEHLAYAPEGVWYLYLYLYMHDTDCFDVM